MMDEARKNQDDILGDEDQVLPADEMDVKEIPLDDDDEDFEEDIDDED